MPNKTMAVDLDIPNLEVRNLSKTYKDFQLKDIQLILEPGMIMGLMGRNGAGKSTTIQAIMDLIRPDAGEILVFGKTMSEAEIQLKDQIGYVSDTPILNESWTAEETFQFARKFYTNWDEPFVHSAVSRFDIPLKKDVTDFSKGMKMKLALILAMAHRPRLLLLDEPTAGLDPVVREEMLDLILDYMQEESRSVLFSSHITSDVEKIADLVTFIDQGNVLLSEDKEMLLDRYRRIVVYDDATMTLLHTRLFHSKKTREGYIGYTDDFETFQNQAQGNWQAERLTLEELFVLLTNKKKNSDD